MNTTNTTDKSEAKPPPPGGALPSMMGMPGMAPLKPPTKWDKVFMFAVTWVGWFFSLGDTPVLRRNRAVLRVSGVGFIVLMVWSIVFEIDHTVHVVGQVVARSRSQVIQSVDGGVIVEIKVKEGDDVKIGDVLAILEKDRAQAAYNESYGRVAALRMAVSRLTAEVADTPLKIDTKLAEAYPQFAKEQINLYYQRQRYIKDRVRQLEENIHLAQEELAMNEPLAKTGDVSRADIIRLKRSVNEVQVQISADRNRYFQEASAELTKAREELNSQEQSLSERTHLLERTKIIAPATGKVKSIRYTTPGAVLRSGDEFMQILPTESELVIEAKVRPADMASIAMGLPVKIKMDAFDSSIFGSYHGYISYISPDSLTEETRLGQEVFYRVRASISEKQFSGVAAKKMEVQPGMTVSMDVIAGQRSVFSYVTKPVSKTIIEALGQR